MYTNRDGGSVAAPMLRMHATLCLVKVSFNPHTLNIRCALCAEHTGIVSGKPTQTKKKSVAKIPYRKRDPVKPARKSRVPRMQHTCNKNARCGYKARVQCGQKITSRTHAPSSTTHDFKQHSTSHTGSSSEGSLPESGGSEVCSAPWFLRGGTLLGRGRRTIAHAT